MALALNEQRIDKDDFTLLINKTNNQFNVIAVIETVMEKSPQSLIKLIEFFPDAISYTETKDLIKFLLEAEPELQKKLFNFYNFTKSKLYEAESNEKFVQLYWNTYKYYMFSCANALENVLGKVDFGKHTIQADAAHPAKTRIYLPAKELTVFLKKHPDFIQCNVELTQTNEAILFEDQNKDVLLEYAKNNVFVNVKNEERFINLADKYPLEVVKYVQKRAQNSKTMDFHGYINTIMKISARATAALAVWKPEEIKIESKEVFEHFLNDCDYEGFTDYFNVNNI